MSEFVAVVVVVIFAIIADADATVIIICGPGGRRGRGGWVGVGWGMSVWGGAARRGGRGAMKKRGGPEATRPRRARNKKAGTKHQGVVNSEKQISRHEAKYK